MKNEVMDLILAQWRAFAPGINEGPLIGLALLVVSGLYKIIYHKTKPSIFMV